MFENEERRREDDYLRAVADQQNSLFIQQQQSANYGLKQCIMSIVEQSELNPNQNPLPNSPQCTDLFKRSQREADEDLMREDDYDDEADDADDDDDHDTTEGNQAMAVYEHRQKKITKKKKQKKRPRSCSSEQPPKKKTKTKEKKKNKKMCENGPKNMINPYSLSEAEESTNQEPMIDEKSWSDQGEEDKRKEQKKLAKKTNIDDDVVLKDCMGCIMLEAKWNDGEEINKCPPFTVCKKRCQDSWEIDYEDVLDWMESCIGCAMVNRFIWGKAPPNCVCDLCKEDKITYEKAKKMERWRK